MMKKLNFLLILTCYANIGLSQDVDTLASLANYKVSYMMYYQQDSTDINTKMSEPMELFTNGKKSVFRSTIHAYIDSSSNGLKPVNRIPLTSKSSIYSIEKDFLKGKLSYYGSIRLGKKDFYRYDENMNAMTWDLHEDTTTMNGIKCQKASVDYGGRNWVAWFATDIPIQDGPYKFFNLPGLVVNIHSSDGYWRFELTNIQEVTSIPEVSRRTIAESIPKSSYYKLKRDYLHNAVEMEEATGNSIFIFSSMEDRRRVIEGRKASARKDNNWIELYP